MEFTPMSYIKNYKYIVKKSIRNTIIIGVTIFLIILTAYYIVDGFGSSSISQLNNREATTQNSEEKSKGIDEQISEDIQYTNYENMIYKGGSLPLPFPEDYAILTSPFNPSRIHPITGVVRPHKGVDIVGKKNTKLLAVADGVVTVSGFNSGGYGNWVEIEHNLNGKIIRTRYGHMRDTPLVKVGDRVTAGTVIGIQGQTGGATGDHLHFEVRINGEAVNPLPYLLGKENIETYQQW